MAKNDDKLGDINVSMRDGNTIGHVGHIVFQEPPPSPNSIWQNGSIVGAFGPGVRKIDSQTYFFPRLFGEPNFNERAEFMVQGVRLKIVGQYQRTTASFGGQQPQKTIWNATCEVVALKP